MPDTPCPFSFAVVRSTILSQDVIFVRSRKLTIPPHLAHLPVFSWPELLHLLASGVTSTDLPRLVAIRDQFGGRFGASTPRGNAPAEMPPAPAEHPVAPKPTQGDLFS